jgi:hypothetical protein
VPDLDTITMARCAHRDGEHIVRGDKGIYTITIGPDAGPSGASCTCPAFKYRGGLEGSYHCKHIVWFRAHGCTWNELYDGGKTRDGCCPECGSDEIDFFRAAV